MAVKQFTVDKIEGDRAVLKCENGDTAVLERRALPKHIHEGDILHFEGGSCYLNAEETEKRSQKLRAMMERLLEQEDLGAD